MLVDVPGMLEVSSEQTQQEIVLSPPVTVPAPLKLKNVWLNPFKSTVAPAETSTFGMGPKALPDAARNVPACTIGGSKVTI